MQFVYKAEAWNDTVIEFLSPTVNDTDGNLSFRTVLELDNIQENLTEFEYHSDPEFTKMMDKPISAGSIIIVNVSVSPWHTCVLPDRESIMQLSV